MRHWLLKSEAGCYSLEDLRRDGHACWDGVRNYQARNFLRDMQQGDLCVYYHSGGDPPEAVGVCSVVATAYPDHTQFDPVADHYDAASSQDDPRWSMVDVAFQQAFAKPVTLPAMRANPALSGMRLLARGNRLSVTPLTREQFEEIVGMGK